jgi:hypothetical protein
MDIQVIKCKTCNKIFGACEVPECYIDKDWLKDLRMYVKQGHIVSYVKQGELVFGGCRCLADKKEQSNERNKI